MQPSPGPFILLLYLVTLQRPLASPSSLAIFENIASCAEPVGEGGRRTGRGGEGTFVFYFFMLMNIYFMLHEVAGVYLAGKNLGREERNVKISRIFSKRRRMNQR